MKSDHILFPKIISSQLGRNTQKHHLCDELFTRINEHTSELSCDSVIDAIKQNADVIAFEANYKSAFQALKAQLYELLIDNQVKNVAALKKEITNRIFELCKQFNIVDKYLVYKAFDDIWEQISLDLEAIRLQGFDAARSIEDIEVYDKKGKKAVKKGEEGRVIPFALIQKHLFTDEYTQMDSLNKELPVQRRNMNPSGKDSTRNSRKN